MVYIRKKSKGHGKENMIEGVLDKGCKVVVVEGLNDYIIVDKDEVLLIFPKEKEQDIKALRKSVGEKFGNKYV
jgi:mannose-1-phosphate guanylyltransferase